MTTVLFIRVFTGRLHDLGRSGWWQLVPYGLMIGVVIVAVATKMPEDIALDAAFLIQFIFTLALGLMPGEPRANRFGRSPREPSPLALAETFR